MLVPKPVEAVGQASEDELPVVGTLEELERRHISNVLRQVSGNRMAAAKALGISRRSLYRRLERYQMTDIAPARRGGRRSS